MLQLETIHQLLVRNRRSGFTSALKEMVTERKRKRGDGSGVILTATAMEARQMEAEGVPAVSLGDLLTGDSRGPYFPDNHTLVSAIGEALQKVSRLERERDILRRGYEIISADLQHAGFPALGERG